MKISLKLWRNNLVLMQVYRFSFILFIFSLFQFYTYSICAAEDNWKKLEVFSMKISPLQQDIHLVLPENSALRSGTKKIQIFEMPIADSVPAILEVGKDDSIWFVMGGGGFAGITLPSLSYIGNLKLSGIIHIYTLPTPSALPSGIKLGADGMVYVTEYAGNKIAIIDPIRLLVKEFEIPTKDSRPTALDIDSLGNIWFNENLGHKVGRITQNGVITEFPIPTPNSRPTGLVVDRSNNVWFAQLNGNKIGKRTYKGIIMEYAIPTPQAKPTALLSDIDGSLWFSERNGNKIGLIEKGKQGIREFSLPSPNSGPFFLVNGPDDAIWFTQLFGNRLGRLDKVTGQIAEIELPISESWPAGLGFDSKGNLWFSLQLKNKIAVILQ